MYEGCCWLQTCETVCGSPLPPCPLSPVQTDSLPTLLVRRKFPFPLSGTQTLNAGGAARGGDFQLHPLPALSLWTSHLISLGPFPCLQNGHQSEAHPWAAQNSHYSA